MESYQQFRDRMIDADLGTEELIQQYWVTLHALRSVAVNNEIEERKNRKRRTKKFILGPLIGVGVYIQTQLAWLVFDSVQDNVYLLNTLSTTQAIFSLIAMGFAVSIWNERHGRY